MGIISSRHCPLCGGRAVSSAYSHATRFNSIQFDYLKCGACFSVFVDPVPNNQTFAKMYAKAAYHDLHYEVVEGGEYFEAACLLKKYLPAGSKVLDYGCGVGAFLKASAQEGFIPVGVEFDEDIARFAGLHADCETFSVDQFLALIDQPKFDAIHLGDVLEHLPDPAPTLNRLLNHLKPGGVLFVEGPLEINPSPVYWSARTFGLIKRIAKPHFVATHSPTHLFRTDAKQQLAFFRRAAPRHDLLLWSVYETGWPYSSGGAVKRCIACVARLMSGKRIFGVTLGNRFRGVFRIPYC